MVQVQAAVWETIPKPPAEVDRIVHATVYNPTNDKIYMIGGNAAGAAGNESTSERIVRLMSESPAIVISSILATETAFAAVALYAVRAARALKRQRLGLVWPALPGWGYVAFALGAVLVAIVGSLLVSLVQSGSDTPATIENIRAHVTWLSGTLMVLTIAIPPGFVEEMFFRGYIQRRLLRRMSAPAAIAITSIAFALVHVECLTILFAAPLGVWLGVMAWRTGSALPGAICHAVLNGLWNIWGIIVAKGVITEGALSLAEGVILVVAVIGFAASIVLLVRMRPLVARPVETPVDPPPVAS